MSRPIDKFVIAFMRIAGVTSVTSLVVISFSLFLLLLVHIFLSFYCGNFDWLGAFGAVLTIVSLILSISHSSFPKLKADMYPPAIKVSDTWFINTEGNRFTDTVNEEVALSMNSSYITNIREKYRLVVFTYLLSITGTLLWAYSGFVDAKCS